MSSNKERSMPALPSNNFNDPMHGEKEKNVPLCMLVTSLLHEINNPINYVYLSSKTLEKDLAAFREEVLDMAGSDEETRHYFEKKFSVMQRSLTPILDGSCRIKNIVRELRDFSRLNQVEKSSLRLSEALQSSLRLVAAQYGSQMAFTTDFQTEGLYLGYATQLNQAFLNIIVNACQAIAKRQHDEHCAPCGQLTITLADSGREMVISCTDNGCGMNEDIRKNIFEPFFTAKPAGQGTGLGLSISHEIIQRHNGRISVQSQPGCGTVVTIYLPY